MSLAEQRGQMEDEKRVAYVIFSHLWTNIAPCLQVTLSRKLRGRLA
jgi:hypothetical protein